MIQDKCHAEREAITAGNAPGDLPSDAQLQKLELSQRAELEQCRLVFEQIQEAENAAKLGLTPAQIKKRALLRA